MGLPVQSEPREIETSFGAEGRVANIQTRLEATPHLWGFIGIVYVFAAFFALVILLDVTHH